MTPEQKIARLTGLCSRVVSLVSTADVMLPTDQNAASGLLHEAMLACRDIRALRSPSIEPPVEGGFPSLTIMDGGVSQQPPLDLHTVREALRLIASRLTLLESRMGGNGGPPLGDPPEPTSAA